MTKAKEDVLAYFMHRVVHASASQFLCRESKAELSWLEVIAVGKGNSGFDTIRTLDYTAATDTSRLSLLSMDSERRGGDLQFGSE